MLSVPKFYPSSPTMILGLGYTLESHRNHFKKADPEKLKRVNFPKKKKKKRLIPGSPVEWSLHSQVILKQSYQTSAVGLIPCPTFSVKPSSTTWIHYVSFISLPGVDIIFNILVSL